jgi:hypothetical protein
LKRLTEQAQALGANAVINLRFSTSSIAAGAAEILCYGTAVLVEEPSSHAAELPRHDHGSDSHSSQQDFGV